MNSFLKVILILLNTHSIPSTILEAARDEQLLGGNINLAEYTVFPPLYWRQQEMNRFLKVILILLNTHSIPSTILEAAGHQQLLEGNINLAEYTQYSFHYTGGRKP